MRRQQHSFSTHERVFLLKCHSFWDRKCLDLRETRTPNLRIHAECSNHLSYQGQTFVVPCFEHWLWRHRYFWSKVNIWTVNCARKTAFIFDTRTDVLVKVSKFWDIETENVSTWEGLEPPIFGFMPNALTIWTIRARHLLSHVWNPGSGGIDIIELKLTFELLTVRGQQHSC